jgi:Uncharacterized FAD-dependent dehydrogenases
MLRISELTLPLSHTEDELNAAILDRLGIPAGDLLSFTLFRRSYDARKKTAITLNYTIDVEVKDEAAVLARHAKTTNVGPTPDTSYHYVTRAPASIKKRPVVIGFGPCGLFAALILAEMGFNPIILERGKTVRERTKDTWGLWRQRELKPESNVQFGEGGAGTFSDGKLYSQVKDPKHYGRKVLAEFVAADAPPEIMYVSKPHIGTFRLVKMIQLMREKIEKLGGEFRFEQRVEDVLIEDGQIRGLTLNTGEQIEADHVVLAIGHSARDTFEMLYERGVYIEAKPFSIGFRAEHPQSLIDKCRFGPGAGHPILGAADYKLVHHASNGRSVYSFCMCPGRHGGGGDLRAGPRGHQRHEPVFAQRAQCQQRHRGGHLAGRLSGPSAGRHRLPARVGKPRLRTGRRQLQCAGATGGRLHRQSSLDPAGQRGAIVQAGRDPGRPQPVAAQVRHRCHPRGAAGFRKADPWLLHA